MITVVALSPSVDVTYVVEDFHLAHQHRPSQTIKVPGGKALNCARAAGAAGAEVHTVAVLGGHSGAWLADSLTTAGIVVEQVRSPYESRTCISVASGSAELTEIYEHPAPLGESAWTAVLDRIAQLRENSWLSVSGSFPPDRPPDIVRRLAGLVAKRHGLLALDTSGATLAEAIEGTSSLPALLKVNRSEAAAALARNTGSTAAGLLSELRERGIPQVVITDGVRGSVGADQTGRYQVRLADTERWHGRFPVGSGDCYLGGMLAALDAGADLAQAMAQGTVLATANAMVPGAAVFDTETVQRLATEIVIERLA